MTMYEISLSKDALPDIEPLIPSWPPPGRTGEWWLFWRDDHPKGETPLLHQLSEAVAYFQKKYHVKPNLVEVPYTWSALLSDENGRSKVELSAFPGLRIRRVRTLLKDHLMLTVLQTTLTEEKQV